MSGVLLANALADPLERLRGVERPDDLVSEYRDALDVAKTWYDGGAVALVEEIGGTGLEEIVAVPTRTKADRRQLALFHGGLMNLTLQMGESRVGARAVVDAVPAAIMNLDVSDACLTEFSSIQDRVASAQGQVTAETVKPDSGLGEVEAGIVRAGLDSLLLSQALSPERTEIVEACSRLTLLGSHRSARAVMGRILNGRIMWGTLDSTPSTSESDRRAAARTLGFGYSASEAMLIALENPMVPIMGRKERVVKNALAFLPGKLQGRRDTF